VSLRDGNGSKTKLRLNQLLKTRKELLDGRRESLSAED
jgi:hypothetical protein